MLRIPFLPSMKFTAGVRMLELGGEHGHTAGFVGVDPLRLTVSFDGGLGGYEADEILIEGVKVHSFAGL